MEQLRELFLSFNPNKDKPQIVKEEIEYTEFTEVEEEEIPLGI